jgi:hypothetical protein
MPIPNVNPTGVTAIETILGAVTVSGVLCVTPAMLAEILAVPLATEFTSPFALIAATAVAEELHDTRFVTSELLPSL